MDQTSWLALCLAPNLGSVGIEKLVAQFGSADAIVSANRKHLEAHGLSAATIAELKDPDADKLGSALNWLGAPDHHLIHWQDPRYPNLLRVCGNSPPVLFVDGDADALALPQIAIVGSRNATPGGRENAAEFAGHLASAGILITSGLASGIDSAAHAGAIQGGGKTIAVMGTGPDQIYPRENSALAQQIRENGALISEFPPGMPAKRENFPRRNRIISGLSLGVVVVEAGMRSGSLITARYSGDCGREVFAVPGSIHSPVSKGCHRLIKQGAKLVESSSDIIEELASLAGAISVQETPLPDSAELRSETEPTYEKMLCSMGFEPIDFQTLVKRCGLTAGELSSMLLILELEGRVETLPGGHFQQLTGWNRPHE